jgi:hypothetical protein
MSTPAVTGYDPDISFYATRYKQGGRTVFSLDLSLTQVAELLPAPSAANPTEGNRRVNEAHARAFGTYVREEDNWVAPALVLRAPDIFAFTERESVAGTQFGVISFPRLASTDLRILDGQHRILGIHLAIQGIAADLEKARAQLAAVKRNGAEPAAIDRFSHEIAALNAQRERFGRDRTTIQVFIEDDQVAYQQMFFDIADNALGITGSVRVRFDSRKVVNRSLDEVMQHVLLKDRVDREQDRMGPSNPNLMGAKHVADIVRTLAVGIEGRIGKRLEDEISEGALVEKSNNFLDVLLAGFPAFEAVVEGELTPAELRRSLLGSTVMQRILAGVYKELIDERGFEDEDVIDFFSQLAPHMAGAVAEDSIWIRKVPGDLFTVGATGPRSRYQDLKTLRNTMLDWAMSEPSSLTAGAPETVSYQSPVPSPRHLSRPLVVSGDLLFPDYKERRRAVLEALSDGRAHSTDDIQSRAAKSFGLTAEQVALEIPGPNGGNQSKWVNDVAHVLARPRGQFEKVSDGIYRITDLGTAALT